MEMQSWNGLRMPKERKWAEDAQGGSKGPRKPVSKGMDQGSPSGMNADPMTLLGHCNQVKEEHTAGPKEAQQTRIK